MYDPVWSIVAQAIAETIAAGTYHDQPIDAAVMGKFPDGTPDPSGRLNPPCVRILPPGFGVAPLEEGGSLITGSEWPIMLYTGISGEISFDADVDFFTAVYDALESNHTINDVCVGSYIVSAPSPEPVSYGGEAGAERMLLRRELTLHLDHE